MVGDVPYYDLGDVYWFYLVNILVLDWWSDRARHWNMSLRLFCAVVLHFIDHLTKKITDKWIKNRKTSLVTALPCSVVNALS